MKKKIVILGFGGTIAMVQNDHGALVPAKSIADVLQFVPQMAERAELELQQIVNLDSPNVTPAHWLKLATTIRGLYGTCDGIIVIHGTDTMAYTAGAVALALGRDIQLPVVFTGSQLPIDQLGSDAVFNLGNSLKTTLEAIKEDVAEVMIAFSDKVLRAARTIKVSDARFDAFESPAFPHLAHIAASQVIFSPIAFRRQKTPAKQSTTPAIGFKTNIFTVDVVPGLDPKLLEAVIDSKKCDGILLKSLGAGNVPAEGEHSLLPFIKHATAKNIPVLIVTKFVGGKTVPTLYETGRRAVEMGAMSTGDMTDVMAQIKLMWLLSKGFTSLPGLGKDILRDYVGEVS